MTPALEIASRVGRVGGHMLRERIRRAPLRSAGEVPRSPDDLTTEWLTAALCAEHPGANVTGLEISGGTTGTSTRRRLHLTYDEQGRAAGLPTHLYAKTTTTMTQRLMLGLTAIIEVEGRFYDRVRPLLELEAPEGYFASFDPASWRSIVITEDIGATRGAEFFSPETELTLGQTKELVAAMARWHGTLWRHPVLDGGWLHTTAERHRALSRFLDWGKRSAVGVKKVGALIPDGLRSRHHEVLRCFDAAMRSGSEGAHTFLHGDPHSGGNYYSTGEGRMGWADWGVCLRGGWGYDYSYAVATCLTIENRRAWERELLEHYLAHLAEAGGEAPGFDAAWRTYRQQLFYPYVGWSAVYGHGPLQPDSQPPEYCLPIIERAAHAICDLDAIRSFDP